MKILIVILGLIVAALTWFIIFILIDLIEYTVQEINHEWRKFKCSLKQQYWDLEWVLKHR